MGFFIPLLHRMKQFIFSKIVSGLRPRDTKMMNVLPRDKR